MSDVPEFCELNFSPSNRYDMYRYFLLPLLSLLSVTCFAQHTLVFTNGDMIKGELTFVKDQTVTFFHNGRSEDFALEQIRTIHFYDQMAEDANESVQTRKEFKNGFNKVSYVMEGRTMTKFPKIALGSRDNGVVVVDVLIDKYGNVKSADPGASGTQTTNDKYLFTKAKAACQGAKFNSDPVAPLSTRGKIWVEF